MRIALVHDWLTGMRGGERVLDELALLIPDAELFTLIHVPGTTSSRIEALPIHASPLSRLPGIARHYRKLLPLFPAAIRGLDLSDFDFVISCSHAFAKSVRTQPGTPHLCYCLTPIRYVWDQADEYLGRGALRALASPLVSGLRRFDRGTSGPESVTRYCAISTTVQERILHCYGREASVVHPPVDVDRFRIRSAGPDDFYLLVSSFVPYKRDALAIEAFRRLGRRLVVVGDGPGRARLRRNAPANVEFVGRIPDDELAVRYACCRALIQPQLEDFGISAIEAQASGRPVIAFGAGGARDTVRPLDASPGEPATGLSFDEPTPDSLIAAVEQFERSQDRFDPAEIRRWAEGFGRERFRREFEIEVAATSKHHEGPATRAPVRGRSDREGRATRS